MTAQTLSDDGRVSLLLELEDQPGALGAVLGRFATHGVNLTHIESRPAQGGRFDFFVDCEGRRDDAAIRALLADLAACTCRLLVLDERAVPWFPRHISELEAVVGHVLEAGSELQSDHPGFSDPVYRARRAEIDTLARDYRYGSDLPLIEYSAAEVCTWSLVWQHLQPLHERHACAEYLRNLALMQHECGYGAQQIPQARDLSAFLQVRTGFRLWPVSGLLAARDFLAGLAFRVFFCSQYIRHQSRPLYTPEPDVCHELIGHVPMFADPAFAQLSQEIGLASLGASDEEILELARCYWFSVEFGLVRPGPGEPPGLKAYGAGLLSSAGELAHACEEGSAPAGGAPRPGLGVAQPRFEAWRPEAAARQDFPITEYQPLYFVADSLQDASERMRRHCEQLARPFHARYNPMTCSIWVDRAVRRGG